CREHHPHRARLGNERPDGERHRVADANALAIELRGYGGALHREQQAERGEGHHQSLLDAEERKRWRRTTLWRVAASLCSTEDRIASAWVGESALVFSFCGCWPCGFCRGDLEDGGSGRIKSSRFHLASSEPGSSNNACLK